MNKTEYLKRLSDELGHMPYGDVKDIIQSIEEHFTEGLGEGRSEEEIAESLGDPKELAAEFKDGAKFKQIMKKRKKLLDNYTGPDGRGRIFVVVFNLFVGIAMWIVLLAAIIAAFMFLAADCGIAGLIIASLIMGKLTEFLVPFIFLVLTLICIAVFLIAILILGVKYYIRGLKAYIKWNKHVWNYGLGED
ncbi:MAG: DUF1700 domain-containing protein [Saccharofermentans sp.]|nr:DUF1700 domain-containing protein [Saccharofermentans sp.]